MSQTMVWGLSLLIATAAPCADAAPGETFQVRVPHQAGTAVRRALASVKHRLADTTCREVLGDFTSEGRSLDAVLAERGRSPQEHLETLVFQDGSGRPRCASPGILAFTHVGGDTIFVCSAPFARAAERDPAFAAVVLIHETLHTLGLRENPPTSGEITARVARRCGG